MVPIVMDDSGDICSVENYRGLTLSSVFSQLFEHCLMLKFGYFLESGNLQFGFKKGHSTSHAVFVMKHCVDYFVENGSCVFVTFMDCTKGFDKVSHYGMFLKMMRRGFPLCFIRIMM